MEKKPPASFADQHILAETCAKSAEAMSRIALSRKGREALAAYPETAIRVSKALEAVSGILLDLLLDGGEEAEPSSRAPTSRPEPILQTPVSRLALLPREPSLDAEEEAAAEEARVASMDENGRIAVGPLVGYWPSQRVTCRECHARETAYQAAFDPEKQRRWPQADLCAACGKGEAPTAAIWKGTGRKPQLPAVTGGPFRGLTTYTRLLCNWCGKERRVHQAKREGWPTRDCCAECAPKRAERPVVEDPWVRYDDTTPAVCGLCGARYPAGTVRRTWPSPELCDLCEKETRPEGEPCEAHKLRNCVLCRPHHYFCPECKEVEVDAEGLLCKDCIVKSVQNAVHEFVESVQGKPVSPSVLTAAQENGYMHVKGPNPHTKKRPEDGKRQSWREKRAATRLQKG